MGPTLALAQAGGSDAGAKGPERAGKATQSIPGAKDLRTTGEARGSGRSTGDAVTTGSDVPQDKPNLSNSPESSDTSQKVK
jgi:hypothetical protein